MLTNKDFIIIVNNFLKENDNNNGSSSRKKRRRAAAVVQYRSIDLLTYLSYLFTFLLRPFLLK